MGKGAGYSSGPRTGEVMTGMVKSYNRKGFGFIMCQNLDVDVYFSRESLAPALQTSDLAGEYVTFEVTRFPDGKLQARNLRPVTETGITRGPDGFGGITSAGRGKGCIGKGLLPTSMIPGGKLDEEDRSRDWYCEGCGERNFVKRFECFKCKAQRPREEGAAPVAFPPPPPRRALSPHAGSRAMREMFRQRALGKGGGDAGGSRSRSRSRKRRSPSVKRPRSESSDSSSSSSDDKKKRKRTKKKKKRGRSSDSSDGDSSSSDSGAERAEASTAAPSNPEVEKAKAEVLEKLLKLKEIENREARMKEWRALLRDWHPDKNPDKVEVATAVFQFLQKGKALIDS